MCSWIERIPYRRQWQTGLTLSLGALTAGTTAGWSSPYIAKLTAPNSTDGLKLTTSEASWIASLRFVGRLIGTIFSALLQGFMGRKMALLLTCLPQAVGWSLIIISPTVPSLYASRILTGMTTGMIITASASFLGEIADPMIRGSLITLIPNGIFLGALLGTIMGGFLSMEIYSYVCLTLTGLFFVIFIFVPESPYHYMAEGNLKNAEKSLKWYKKNVDVNREFEEMRKMIGNQARKNYEKIFHEFKKREHRKNFFLIYLFTTIPYLAGLNTTDSYAEIILTKSKINLTPSVVVMALTFSAIFAGLVAIFFVDKIGRKCLLVGSGIGLAVGYIFLGLHFHLLALGIDEKSINWLPILSLFIVYTSVPCGIGTVRDSLIGELFPPNLKTLASFIYVANTSISSFAISKLYQPYNDLVGEKYVFWTFATFAGVFAIGSYLFVPETTRMKLIDIQNNLKNDVKINDVKNEKIEI